MGEYIKEWFKDVVTSTNQFDIELENFYVSFLWMITGERPGFNHSLFRQIKPLRNFGKNGWGGLGVGLRLDKFWADESVYKKVIIPVEFCANFCPTKNTGKRFTGYCLNRASK